MVRAEESRRLQISGAAHGGDFGSKRFGNLDRKSAHAARGAIDQDSLTWPDMALVAKALKRGDGSHRHGCRLKKGQVQRLHRHLVLNGANILRKSSQAPRGEQPAEESRKDIVSGFELRDAAADRFNSPSDIGAENLVSWRPQASAHEAGDPRALQNAGVQWIHGCRMNFYQDFIVGGHGDGNFLESQHVRRPVL